MLFVLRMQFLCQILCLLVTADDLLLGDSLGSQKEDELATSVELDESELLDEACKELANAEFNYYSNRNADSLNQMIEFTKNMWLREHDMLDAYKQSSAENPELSRKLELIQHPGNGALSEEDRNALAELSRKSEEVIQNTRVECYTTLENCTALNFTDIEHLLKKSRDADELKDIWTKLQSQSSVVQLNEEYLKALPLVTNAATENGFDEDIEKYWLMLSEYPGTYEDAIKTWNSIRPLYEKLHKHVSKHLKLLYGEDIFQNSSNIPVHFLGSISGDDWSNVADVIFQNSSVYSTIKKNLKDNKGSEEKSFYKQGEKLLMDLSFGSLLDSFWEKSVFNEPSCNTHIVRYCDTPGSSNIFTCDEPTWQNFAESHGVYTDAMIQKTVSGKSNLLRNGPRSPVIYEAIQGLFSLFSLTPDYLNSFGILEEDQNKIADETLQLLIALHTLPNLAYYLANDMWRMEVINNNVTSVENVNEIWRNFREEYQLVSEPEGNTIHFIEKSEILGNEPYLGKFASTILQFQLLDYYKTKTDNTSDIMSTIREDAHIRELLEAGFLEKWPELLKTHFNIESLEPQQLLTYLKPMEEYLDSYKFPDEQKAADQRALDQSGTSSATDSPTEQTNFGTAILFSCIAVAAVGVVGMFFIVGRHKLRNRRQYERTKSEVI